MGAHFAALIEDVLMAPLNRLFFCAFWQKLDFFKSQKTRFLPKTRFQKSKNSILGHKIAPKSLQILQFSGKSCLKKVRQDEFCSKTQ